MNITTNLAVSLNVAEALANGLGAGTVNYPLNYALGLSPGTGASKAQLVFSKTTTAAASTPDTYTLSGLTDAQGRAVALAKVRLLAIANLSATDGDVLTVGDAATHAWAAPFGSATDKVKVRAGSILVLTAPLATAFAVTSSSSDQLMLDPGTSAIPYSILVVGE